jgi:3-hydroxybutyryl-CoA dehydrogenase
MTERPPAIQRVGVVGCGLMGSGIAETCARAGYDTLVHELNAEFAETGMGRIRRSMETAVTRGKLAPADRDAAAARLRMTTDLAQMADRDIVIEAVTEDVEQKRRVFGTLDQVCRPDVILASNTSSIPINQMATATRRGDRVLGMHFMNPVPVMRLVELVRSVTTSDETLATARAFGEGLSKRVIVAPDRAGFIVNLLLVPYLLDAVRALESGIGTREDIDIGMVLGCGLPMGPLTLLDFVGLDTTYYIANIMFDELKDSRYAPPPLLKQMVLAGFHGRKSGRGFYNYAAGEDRPV